ncbi:MAG TPA: Nif3-like dinuclear metal center hexameric protein [Chondromyces sp.]|nr:Nif3-like dinuclear metal center hexameric protein [Chondromyces sp.]
MKTVNGHEIIQLFERFAPKSYMMEGDKVGLQIGKLNQKVERVMVALDVLEEVVDEAIEKKVQLIIAHHPLIFRPLASIRTDETYGRMIEKLIKHDIAVYAAHTNLDVAPGGVNDLLAEALDLKDTKVLVPTLERPLKKLVVFAPQEDADNIRAALGKAGAGSLGNYSHCSFSFPGTGRFLPGQDADPHIGAPGVPESVPEERIEVIFPQELEKKVITAMLKAHPYEEVAYDLYSLENKEETLGLGRIGNLPEEMTLKEFAEFVKERFSVQGVRVVGKLEDKVRKVAVLGGDGNKYFKSAKFNGADVYVTGDFYYHTAHDAMMAGLNVVDPGHNIEKVMKSGVAQKMAKLCGEKGYKVEFLVSEVHTDPFTFL